jgi:murein DD-endopeptidase MepM/ murein hydrolase activator NlpD
MERLSNKVEIQNQSYAYLFDRINQNKDYLRHLPAVKPVSGEVISGFGMRMHPIKAIRKMHTGIDFTANLNTPVHAAGDGVVRLAGQSRGGYGVQVEVDHGGYGYITKYAHLASTVVQQGEHVKRGQIIGYSGTTGLSKGPHLHYEVIKDGQKIDPIDYFYGDQTPEEYVKLREAAKMDNESMD